MKKKLSLIILLVLVIMLSGCGNNKFVLKDSKFGTVTMNYSKKTDFTFKKNKDNEYKLTSKKLNVVGDLYIDKTTLSYNNSKKIRTNYKGYQEYKFNDYKAYTYSQYGLQTDLQVFVYLEEKDENTILYMHLKPLDENKKVDLKKAFDDEYLIKMLKSIKYEKR